MWRRSSKLWGYRGGELTGTALHLPIVEFLPGPADYKCQARRLLDESALDQFRGGTGFDGVRLLGDQIGFRPAWEHGPRRPLRLSHEIHLQLNHILEGLMTPDAHYHDPVSHIAIPGELATFG